MNPSAAPLTPHAAALSRRPLSLAPAEVHLWLAFYDEVAEELHAEYRDLLAPAEKGQEPRFHFARDRRRYLVTRALVRTVLSRYLPIAPRDWVFATNAYGRPEIANASARGARLSFNLSHTHSLIVLGVTRGRALGVDVENAVGRTVSLDIADRYFAPEEVAALARVPPSQRQHRFFEYWTFKESYIKARGMGLSIPLDKFRFHFCDERTVGLWVDPELSDQAARWELYQLRPRPEYLVAVCTERSLSQPLRLVVREAIPLQSEKTLALECGRTSVAAVEAADDDACYRRA